MVVERKVASRIRQTVNHSRRARRPYDRVLAGRLTRPNCWDDLSSASSAQSFDRESVHTSRWCRTLTPPISWNAERIFNPVTVKNPECAQWFERHAK